MAAASRTKGTPEAARSKQKQRQRMGYSRGRNHGEEGDPEKQQAEQFYLPGTVGTVVHKPGASQLGDLSPGVTPAYK